MGFSLSFVLGLAVLLVYEHVSDTLPGAESLSRLLYCAALIPLPWLIARIAARRVGRAVLRGGVPTPLLRAQLALGAWLVPLVYAGLVLGGDLPRFADLWSPRSYTLQFLILLAPLLVMELGLRTIERRSVRWLDMAGVMPPASMGPERVAMTVFVLLSILILVAATDLLFLDRRLELFFAATSLGWTLGFLAVVGLFSLALPLLFRVVMRATPRLPAHRAQDIETTAAQLGFPPRAVLSVATGHRLVNAALVGPLPWPRYLVLTDGLLALLDSLSLRGVVAHEVGHARARHPLLLLLLYAVVPILAIQPLWAFVVGDRDLADLLPHAAAAVLVVLVSLRVVAHRFEYEADQFAAEALGGAQSCIQALQRVGQLSPQSIHRASFRHPSEERRIRHLRACESDWGYRARFWRRGKVLRAGIAVLVLAAAGACVALQTVVWPLDRAVYLAYTGRFAQAYERLAHLEPGAAGIDAKLVEELRAEIIVGRRLVDDGGEWEEKREVLAARAWDEGRAVLQRDGPAAARPLLALAQLARGRDPVRRSLYLYCSAAAEDDEPRLARLRDHLLGLGVEVDIANVIERR